MSSAQDVETSVITNSTSQDSFHPDHQLPSKYNNHDDDDNNDNKINNNLSSNHDSNNNNTDLYNTYTKLYAHYIVYVHIGRKTKLFSIMKKNYLKNKRGLNNELNANVYNQN